MAYESSGTLTTDKRTVDESETWSSQTDWEAYQSASNIDIVSGVVMLAERTLPPDESFEHNDLSGNYSGDTEDWEIDQTPTPTDGDFALFGKGGGSYSAIVRSTEDAWDRYGKRITFKQYLNPDVSGGGGIAFGTSVTGHSSFDGYYFYADAQNDNRNIRRIDGGSITNIASNTSQSVSGDTWLDGEVIFYSDGGIDFTLGGVTLSATDETYVNLLLAFHSFQNVHLDDIDFFEV